MTSPTRTPLHRQASTVRTLLALIDQYPNLPAADFDVSSSPVGERLTINVHNDPAGFEMWREALGLNPENSELVAFSDFAAVKVFGQTDGIRVRLIGYLPPVLDAAPAAAA
ncbi:hypothetical protein [Streptacidiphilus rugosus]|uniref:hypothetical protein n=1 Tax=Streptacidiphilus rugosus TaxID=405783 RepID=UPI00068FCAFA|nr:hypothetical protein [Streptacidiphilus rugosus]